MPTAALVALIVIGAVNVLVLVALTVAIFAIKGQVEKVMAVARPTIGKVEQVADDVKAVTKETGAIVTRVEELVDRVGSRVEAIADTGEKTVKDLSHRVQVTSQVVQETVTSPVIGVAGLLAGIGRGISVLRSYGDVQGNKEQKSDGEKE